MSDGFVQSWQDAITAALQKVVEDILGFLPNLVGALIIVIAGIILGSIAGKIIERTSQLLHLDSLFEKFGVKRTFEKVGLRLSIAKILGWLVKWFVYVIAFLAAANALELQALTQFINSLLVYIPNVFVAVLILVVGVLLAHFLSEIVTGAAEGAKFKAANFLAAVTRYSIIIFSFLAALVQLGIASSLIETLFTGIIGTIAIAAGIAFGLGGQGAAREVLEKLKRDLES